MTIGQIEPLEIPGFDEFILKELVHPDAPKGARFLAVLRHYAEMIERNLDCPELHDDCRCWLRGMLYTAKRFNEVMQAKVDHR